MIGGRDTETIVRSRFFEFFATLDMRYDPPNPAKAGIGEFLPLVFKSEERFWKYAEQLQSLGNDLSTDERLISQLVDLLSADPLYFLVLMHLHRQMKFTNIELVEILFGREQLNNLWYYENLTKIDPSFGRVVANFRNPERWSAYVGHIPSLDQSTLSPASHQVADRDNYVLASFKKAVSRYLGSEKDCWKLWESRIRSEVSVRRRIAEFVVRYEDFRKLLQEGAVRSALTRNLRTVNVEVQKQEKGKHGSELLRGILKAAGFISLDLSVDIEDLVGRLPRTSDFMYLSEIPWKAQDKRFDIVLVRSGRIGFVVETNYYTTSMSKIGEVVGHFRELKIACRGKYRLLYVTDGIGWFNLMKKVTGMLLFEQKEMEIEPTEIPYLLNLEQFRREINEIKRLM